MKKVRQFQSKAIGKAMTPAQMRQALGNCARRTIVRKFAPGVTFEVQRVDLGTYLAAGLLPQHFYTAMIEAQQQGADQAKNVRMIEATIREMEPADITALTVLRPRFVIAACVSPKVVAGVADKHDQISLLEIPEETQQDIFNWVMAGCPGIPIQVGGEEVPVEDLDRFRYQRTGGKPFTLEPDGESVREEAVRASGD